MAQSDQHPADGLIEAIKGLFNGDNIRQSIRDAYDRVTGQPAAADPDTSYRDEMEREANKSFLPAPPPPDPARTRATVRKKYPGLMSGK